MLPPHAHQIVATVHAQESATPYGRLCHVTPPCLQPAAAAAAVAPLNTGHGSQPRLPASPSASPPCAPHCSRDTAMSPGYGTSTAGRCVCPGPGRPAPHRNLTPSSPGVSPLNVLSNNMAYWPCNKQGVSGRRSIATVTVDIAESLAANGALSPCTCQREQFADSVNLRAAAC